MAITVLGHGQAGLLEPLGLHSGRDGNKLASVPHTLTAARDAAFPAGSAGWMATEVLTATSLGDSTAFLVAVREREDGAAVPLAWQAAKTVVGEDFLRRWADKSVREQAAAREAMHWRD